MNKWVVGGIGLGLLVAAFFALTNGTRGGAEIEYRYGEVTRGELMRSSSATGLLVPLAKVDVKSKAGGKVVRLAVQEGSVVNQGDVVAYIDPRDTQSAYEQALADNTGARARVDSAVTSATMEGKNADVRVQDAQVALAMAKIRLAKAQESYDAQPELSKAELKTAEAGLDSAKQALEQLQKVTVPQNLRDAEGQLASSRVSLQGAEADLERQERLLEKGYVARSAVEQAKTRLEAARASYNLAAERSRTIGESNETQLKTQQARVRQAEESLRQARANQNRTAISARDLEEARQGVKSAQVSLEKAQSDRMNIRLRQSDVQSARASAVRSKVAMENARIQMNETTVIAPRSGVVTVKYLEEGTIIPPGTSTFAQGTSLVQISDVSRMFVETLVDEADIATVRKGQATKIIIEAYPGKPLEGIVDSIYPAAETAQSVTTIKVKVEVFQRNLPKGMVLKPGMNATCEFILMKKDDVTIVPQQAVRREGQETYVLVKGDDLKKPVKRAVKVGDSGDQGTEVLEGLEPGEEVVIAELDMAQMRDRQERMMQQQQGGGFGSLNRGGPSRSLATTGGSGGGGAGAGGGARGGAGGGRGGP